MSEPNSGAGPAGGVVLPRHRRFRPKNLLKGLAILLCGMVIGSALTAHFSHNLMRKFLGNPAQMAERLHHRLNRELDLTPDQDRKVGAIIQKHAAAASAIMSVASPQLEQQFDQMHLEIRQLLNPEQAARWDKHFERMKKFRPPLPFENKPPPPNP